MALFNVRLSLMHPTPMHNDSDEGDNAVQENDNIDDDSDESDNVLQENNIKVATQYLEDDTKRLRKVMPTMNM